MKHTINRIKSVYPLSEDRVDILCTLLEAVELKKGHLLFKEGRNNRDLYFLEKGVARAYCSQTKHHDLTFWFGMEGDILISYNGYINNSTGYETISLLEDALVYKIPIAALENLYNTDIHFANWGRKLMEKEVILTEERFISRQFKTATERYKELMVQMPQLVQRVQLGYIASYLGITQVTLSRIRAELR
ncbi:Crp/Fnr family transcriptional regulator [Chitinophaga nivalis]|uniref:Crp/Fnr family transcriptional regulator n=1 Tax=Chitinophaga nivalis TaxID=2991709 RepID=A0ABT3IGN0_9BACT|nr:Crp/Fnr family transcriptional regulator [Chitinophaga nivalis]MCW3467180.1 Crp/Fnr family transcriptional regulator [Chitinophaga nivalis]MCW3483128.1 Crp/Fnr family transcriptional regulator [Chitinophaga nivalis]